MFCLFGAFPFKLIFRTTRAYNVCGRFLQAIIDLCKPQIVVIQSRLISPAKYLVDDGLLLTNKSQSPIPNPNPKGAQNFEYIY